MTIQTPRTQAYILNIGLNTSAKFPERLPLTEQEIRKTLSNVFPGCHIRSLEIQQSSTEPTAVIEISIDNANLDTAGAFYFVALNLSQDCIAVVAADIVENAPRHLPSGKLDGALSGPYAQHWGEFNADYFLFPTPSQSDAYQGHLPNSGVQRHSADSLYAAHGVFLQCIESNGRRLWQAIDRAGKVIAAHPKHSGASFIAQALLTGA